MSKKTGPDQAGIALLEFAVIASIFIVLLLAVIDVSRALYDAQVSSSLSRQGSNLASRGSTLPETVAAVIQGEAPLDLSRNGEVIVTSVAKVKGADTITGQASQGGISSASKIGQGVGTSANVPPDANTMLQNGGTIYITEIFYSYQPITPLGNFVKVVWPTTLYAIAYF